MNEQLRRAPSPDLLPRFAAIVGDKYAITDPAALEPFLVEGRGLYHGRSSMLLRPGSVGEVQAILKLANETKTPLVPQGGNTGLVGGQIPFDGELILSLTRLDRIREVDPASNAMTCEAGVVLAKAQEAAAAVDRLFPLSLGAEGSCTIGGNLSTNAGGTGAVAYGIARDLVLGLEVVLADGRIMNLLSKLKKNNTGYDLRHIFVGAEGTLGIITAAVVKLFPRPRAVETAFIAVPSPAAAVKLLNLAQARVGGTVTSFELIIRDVVEFAIKHAHGVRDPLTKRHPWYVLMEVSSQHGDGLRESVEQLLADGERARSCRGRDDCVKPRSGKGLLAHAARSAGSRRNPKADRSRPTCRCRSLSSRNFSKKRARPPKRSFRAAGQYLLVISATAMCISMSASRSAPTLRSFSRGGAR